jgi:hypothetical protein
VPKPKGLSPTARTLAALRKEGYVAEVVEKRVPKVFILRDFAGCIDVIAFGAGRGILGVQATSGGGEDQGGHHAARLAKAVAEPRLATWLEAGGRFEVWSWRKAAATGRWTVRREPVTLADISSRGEAARGSSGEEASGE